MAMDSAGMAAITNAGYYVAATAILWLLIIIVREWQKRG